MDSWLIYVSFTFIVLIIFILAGIFQRHILCVVLLFVTIISMQIGAVLHYCTPINNNRTYNNYCRISAHSYSKGFEEGIRVTKEEYEQEKGI